MSRFKPPTHKNGRRNKKILFKSDVPSTTPFSCGLYTEYKHDLVSMADFSQGIDKKFKIQSNFCWD